VKKPLPLLGKCNNGFMILVDQITDEVMKQLDEKLFSPTHDETPPQWGIWRENIHQDEGGEA